MKKIAAFFATAASALVLGGCGSNNPTTAPPAGNQGTTAPQSQETAPAQNQGTTV